MKDALLERYAEHRRDLPLRGTTDPHPTLVSRVLEQTHVARVVPGYENGPRAKVRPKFVNGVGVEQP